MSKNNGKNRGDRDQNVKRQVLLNAEIGAAFQSIDAASAEVLAELDALVQELTEAKGLDQPTQERARQQKVDALRQIASIRREDAIAKHRFALDALGRFGVNVTFAYPQDIAEDARTAYKEILADQEPEPVDEEAEKAAADELAAMREKQAKGEA